MYKSEFKYGISHLFTLKDEIMTTKLFNNFFLFL